MTKRGKPARKQKLRGLNFQDVIFKLQKFWAAQGCVLQQPYDVEMGAGTMHPETFLRVLGPAAYRVGYVQPSRRPTDGRYGENPNRLFKHTQYQVILKPAPADIQNLYLKSLSVLGIRLKDHDIRFEEDNWESPTLGAWGIGWQVLLDGMEITQFTYFQQCGGLDLDPVSVELTYGLERIAAFLQGVNSVFDIRWNDSLTYGQVRLEEELQFSVYNFEKADAAAARSHFESYEAEAARLLKAFATAGEGMRRFPLKRAVATVDLEEKRRFPLLAVYELCLKCSHLFNILDARGAISVTERAALIGRVRQLACRVAAGYVEQQTGEAAEVPA